MQKSIILGLISAILLAVFALLNASIIPVNLWGVEIKSSLALIILITISIGVALGIIISVPSIKEKKKMVKEKEELIAKLTIKLKELTEKNKNEIQ